MPEAPAAELVALLRCARGRVMETVHYRVAPAQRAEFLAVMREVRHVRGRAGAMFWQLYEDVAHPEGWLEVWSMESWTDHLREAIASVGGRPRGCWRGPRCSSTWRHRPPRYLAVDPHEATCAAAPGTHGIRCRGALAVASAHRAQQRVKSRR